jgi:hypothetical protein
VFRVGFGGVLQLVHCVADTAESGIGEAFQIERHSFRW